MNELSLLINALNDHLNFKKRHWKRLESNLSPLESELLSIFLEDSDATDELAADKIFKTDFKDRNYQRLRTSLNQKLTSHILLTSVPSSNETSYSRSLRNGTRLLGVLRALKNSQHHALAKLIADRLYKMASKYGLSEIGLISSHYLHRYYAILYRNDTKVKKYRADTLKFALIQEAEIRAEMYLYDLTTKLSLEQGKEEEYLSVLKDQLEELDSYKKRGAESLKLFLLNTHLNISFSELKYGHKKAIEATIKGLSTFEKRDYNNPNAKSILYSILANSYLAINDLNNAKDAISKSIDLQIKKSINWFLAKRLITKIYMAQGQYESAFDHFFETIKTKQLKVTSRELKFNITIKPYLRYLMITERLNISVEHRPQLSSNSIKENTIDLDNEDPAKIPYILSEMMTLIYKQKKTAAQAQLQLLKHHTKHRVNKTNPDYRRNSFIKMLECLTIGNFHPIAVRRHVEKYHKQLSSVPFEISNKQEVLEIIPYEKMWEMILEDLALWGKGR